MPFSGLNEHLHEHNEHVNKQDSQTLIKIKKLRGLCA